MEPTESQTVTEWNHGALSFPECRRRRVRVNFFGGSISSNGGSMLLREVDRRLRLTMAVARVLGDRRQRGKVRHEVVTMVRQRVHAVALGYEDLNDHDGLRDDLVQSACERDGSGQCVTPPVFCILKAWDDKCPTNSPRLFSPRAT